MLMTAFAQGMLDGAKIPKTNATEMIRRSRQARKRQNDDFDRFMMGMRRTGMSIEKAADDLLQARDSRRAAYDKLRDYMRDEIDNGKKDLDDIKMAAMETGI